MSPDVAQTEAQRDLLPATTDQLRALLEQHAAPAPEAAGGHPTFGAGPAGFGGLAGVLASPILSLVLGMLAAKVEAEIAPALLAALAAEKKLHPGLNDAAILASINAFLGYLGVPPLSPAPG